MCINDPNSPGLSTLLKSSETNVEKRAQINKKCIVVVFHITVPSQGAM